MAQASFSTGKERIRYFIENFQPAFEPPAGLDNFILDLHKTKTRHFITLLSASLVLDHLGEPESEFAVLAGEAGSATYLDISLLNQLFERSSPRP